MNDVRLKISEDFSATPGPRLKKEGKFSGEEFLETHLRPRFRAALEGKTTLLVDLDGTAGFGTSFLEMAFGTLAREFEIPDVLKYLELKSDEEPYLIEEIRKYIREARDKRRSA